MFFVNIWGKQPENYYNDDAHLYLSTLKYLGFTGIIIWEDVPKKFISTAKSIGLVCISLLPSALDKFFLNNFALSESSDRTTLPQASLSTSESFSRCTILELKNDKINDGYIITDIPWYLSALTTTDHKRYAYPSFFDEPSLKLLSSNNIQIKPKYDFTNPNDISEWENIQPLIFELYMNRFDGILNWANDNNKKIYLPISFQSRIRMNMANRLNCGIIENYIRRYKCNIILLNAIYNKNEWEINLKQKYDIDVLGGTEGATGLVGSKNGRQLLSMGYNGLVTNEHHVVNNRHPTLRQLKDELDYLRIQYGITD